MFPWRSRLFRAGLALAFFTIIAFALLLPALTHGSHFATYNVLRNFGLGYTPHSSQYNGLAADQIAEMAPWTDLSWQQVHAGHIPLWNPYSAMGLPLVFNFESQAFSIPMLVAYLFPLGLAYTVTFFVKLVIAATGVYFLSRVLDIDTLPALAAGAMFELSGAFTGWLGWPQAGSFCWLGWILGSAILITKTRRWTPITIFAISLAFSVYGGHPEAVAIEIVVVCAVLGFILVSRAFTDQRRDVLRASMRLVLGGAVGTAIAAPLLLPGAQILVGAVRNGSRSVGALPTDVLANFAFSGFFGYPIAQSHYFGPLNYYETAAFVGPIALVMASLALVRRWRSVEVRALAVGTIIIGAMVFLPAAAHVLSRIPGAREILWTRGLVALDLLVSALAGVGLHVVLHESNRRSVQYTLATITGVSVVAMLGIYWYGQGRIATAAEQHIRSVSIWWATGAVAVAAATTLWIIVASRLRATKDAGTGPSGGSRGWVDAVGIVAVIALIGMELSALLFASPRIEPSSTSGFVSTRAEQELLRIVGDQRLGLVKCTSVGVMPSLGIVPEANDAYHLREVAAYDPIVPMKYFTGWAAVSGQSEPAPRGVFCPSLSSANLARFFGVSYVLGANGTATPSGMSRVADIGGETLYKVNAAGIVTMGRTRTRASGESRGTVVPVHVVNGGTLEFDAKVTRATAVRIHVTDVPGWTATVDGRALSLKPVRDLSFSATLPPGRDRVTLAYWPQLFTVGLVAAGVGLSVLCAGGVVVLLRTRASRRAGR